MAALTAQEALDQFGFIVISTSTIRAEVGKPFTQQNQSKRALTPLGSQLMVVEEITEEEAIDYWKRVGWVPGSPPKYFYKAVAE